MVWAVVAVPVLVVGNSIKGPAGTQEYSDN